MKVLFVCSGNGGCVSPIIKNQADSLLANDKDLTIDFFFIKGKGFKGYLSNVKPLKHLLEEGDYDIVHAHYSMSAFVASLAKAKKMVVSLMGSDVKSSRFYIVIIKLFALLFNWKCVIVKSEDMYSSLGMKKAVVVPNGVNLNVFYPMDKVQSQMRLNWDSSKRHILFPANPVRREKNFQLAKSAVEELNDSSFKVELHYFENVPNSETPIWYNAADVVLMTSLWEGSPNAIKEAMACGRPIVSTDVGDVAFLLNGLAGSFVTSSDEDRIVSAVNNALSITTTDGYKQIIKLGISSDIIAEKILKLYLAFVK